MDKIKIQMRKGILEYIILLVLYDKEYYGRKILEILKDYKLDIVEWTLYPLLNRLAKEELVKYEIKKSSLWPQRKYYKLTDKWKHNITLLKETYDSLDAIIKDLLSKKKLWYKNN